MVLGLPELAPPRYNVAISVHAPEARQNMQLIPLYKRGNFLDCCETDHGLSASTVYIVVTISLRLFATIAIYLHALGVRLFLKYS